MSGAPEEARTARERDWTSRRRHAGWVLEAYGMAKSGYAPRKATLAEWVVEAAAEVEALRWERDRLREALTRIAESSAAPSSAYAGTTPFEWARSVARAAGLADTADGPPPSGAAA